MKRTTKSPAMALQNQAADAEKLRQQAEETKKAVAYQLAILDPAFSVMCDQIQANIYAAMRVQGFWDGSQDNFAAKTALVHSEVSEMLEANRKPGPDDKIPDFPGEVAEAADVIIRLFDMAGRYDWPLGKAITAKMQYNLTRPHKHGKAY